MIRNSKQTEAERIGNTLEQEKATCAAAERTCRDSRFSTRVSSAAQTPAGSQKVQRAESTQKKGKAEAQAITEGKLQELVAM